MKNSMVKIYIKRKLEGKIKKFLRVPEIIAVVGPRQVGKTTLLRRIYDEVEGTKVFLDFEDPEVFSLFNEDVKVFARLFVSGKDFVFIDEFQHARDGGRKLKFLFDHYSSKILLSGSSSLDITSKISSVLAGRIFLFELLPLDFEEFLSFHFPEAQSIIKEHLQEKKAIPSALHAKLLNLLEEFLTFGGYPRVVVSSDREEKIEALKNLLSTYLIKDIMGFFRITTEHSFLKLIKILALQTGGLLNFTELAGLTGLTLHKVKEYLAVLEETYIISLARPFFSNKRVELVKNPKIYFIDLGLRNYLIKDFNPVKERADSGSLFENFIASQLLKSGNELRFWRTKSGAEVDFVVEQGRQLLAVEVKSSSRGKPGKSLLSFIKKYKPAKAFVVHGENLSFIKINNTELIFLPFYAFPFLEVQEKLSG